MWTIAICDDDLMQMKEAALAIRRFADDAGIEVQLEQLQSVDECVREANRFDIVFMDIEFDDGPAGIDAAVRINAEAPNCQIVYLTNYLHYSLDVYHTNHVWFVLKSQLDHRLPEVFQKLAFMNGARRATVAIKPIGEAEIVSVFCNDIRYIERRNRVTYIVLRGGATYAVREKIAELQERLPGAWFGRCHNSYVVNFNFVHSVRSTELALNDGACLPVSRSRSKQFLIKYLFWVESRNM